MVLGPATDPKASPYVARESAVSTALSRAPLGLAAPLVRVEVHLGNGLPSFVIVGLPEAVVRESKERVRAALVTSGYTFPVARITVNLSPADLPKEGGRFDLPIAIGILTASGQLPCRVLDRREFYGELSLSGELRETSKLLPALVAGAHLGNELIIPTANALEASLAASAQIRVADHLLRVCGALQQGTPLPTGVPGAPAETSPARRPEPDLADICGQFTAKRGLEIAAAGDHGVLLVGPPGAGKTMLAQRLPGLLPPLSKEEALEVASLESAAGRRPATGGRRPFRNPHHTASIAALIGGAGIRPRLRRACARRARSNWTAKASSTGVWAHMRRRGCAVSIGLAANCCGPRLRAWGYPPAPISGS